MRELTNLEINGYRAALRCIETQAALIADLQQRLSQLSNRLLDEQESRRRLIDGLGTCVSLLSTRLGRLETLHEPPSAPPIASTYTRASRAVADNYDGRPCYEPPEPTREQLRSWLRR